MGSYNFSRRVFTDI